MFWVSVVVLVVCCCRCQLLHCYYYSTTNTTTSTVAYICWLHSHERRVQHGNKSKETPCTTAQTSLCMVCACMSECLLLLQWYYGFILGCLP